MEQILKQFYDAIALDPPSLKRVGRLLDDLSALPEDKSSVAHLLKLTIKGFGYGGSERLLTLNGELSSNQWRQLRLPIEKHFKRNKVRHTPKPKSRSVDELVPMGKHRVALVLLPDDAVAVVMALIDSVGHDRLSSSLTMPVLNYFAMLQLLSEDHPDLMQRLDPIKKVLESHGWTDGGFQVQPDPQLLREDLVAIVGRGLDHYRTLRLDSPPPPVREAKPQEESLLSMLVASLDLNPETADQTIREFLEIVQLSSDLDQQIEKKLQLIQQVLQTFGWTGDRFSEIPDLADMQQVLRFIA